MMPTAASSAAQADHNRSDVRTGTQAIERAVAVLASFDDAAELGVSDVAGRVGLSVSTTHRIVRALRTAGLLDQDPVSDRYSLGPRLAQLGQLVWDRMGLGLALPILQGLAEETGESVNLGVRRGADVLVLLWAESPQPLRFDQPPGSHVPIHTSAMGKAVLAYSGDPATTVRDLPKLVSVTPRTISRRAELVDELERIRAQGWSLNDEERNLGVRAVGAPVLGADGVARAAISLQGPTVRLTMERVEELVPALVEAARELARVLPVDRL